MPDQDIFNNKFSKGWARVARKIFKGASPEIAALETARALRGVIKEIGGIRNLSELSDMVYKAQKDVKSIADKELFREFENIERNSQNRVLTAIVNKSIWQNYLDYSERNSNQDILFPTYQDLAENICTNYIEVQLHSKIEILDEIDGASNWKDENFRKDYRKLLEPLIKQISESLAKDPSFKKPPRFSRLKSGQLSTEQLLHSPISLT